jgi:hypothetical protein
MESSKIGRYVSIVGAFLLVFGTVFALLGVLLSSPLSSVSLWPSPLVLGIVGAIINVSCSFVLMFAEDSTLRLVAGIVAVMSSITFGGPIAVTGATVGIVGGVLTFKARYAVGLGFGCVVLYAGMVLTHFGISSFAVESVALLTGLLVLTIGTLDLRSNLKRDGDLISILALSIFWIIYAFADSSLYGRAVDENLLLSWQTVPWIFSIILTSVLQVVLALSIVSNLLK